ncbi:diguanylate cyclase (GGDEF)-like protein [Azorhizobium sp. AG788]|uniref:GGDEF domain-containing protein n=1 Tax=Azorhizobium sp. AG788 TaxID=2183897 RepID=UPI00105D2F7A|nr:GGDEF domain-containing protein [Azorhizobium sp. AG788]TDU01293.1 diguanylate cyclase (GGDEF)-like protein [Azorhizobium sp. AG788]
MRLDETCFLILRLATSGLCMWASVLSLLHAQHYVRNLRRPATLRYAGAIIVLMIGALALASGYNESIVHHGREIAVLDWAWAVSDVLILIFYILALRTLRHRDLREARLMIESRRDVLTQLPNRAGFDEQAMRILGDCQRSGLPAAVALFDIDHFKKINDGWGHPAGDAVLKNLADAAQDVTRSTDAFARFGGEEFVMILKGVSAEAAFVHVERIRRAISRDVPHPSGSGRITVSAGLADVRTYDQAGLTAAISRADEALYAAKAAGRDRTMLAATDAATAAASA